jgi:hypothetical protein
MLRLEGLFESQKYPTRSKVTSHKVNPVVAVPEFGQRAVMGPIDQPLRRMKDSRKRQEWFSARAHTHSNCFAEVTVSGAKLDMPTYTFVVERAAADAPPQVRNAEPGWSGRGGTDLYLCTARSLALAEAERVWRLA